MAQLKLNEILIDVSNKVGDGVSTASADGEIFTASDRLKSINEARIILYNDLLETLGIDDFIKMFPEFVTETGAIAKVQSSKLGVYIPLNGAGNSYTNSSKTLVVATGNYSNGLSNLSTLINAPVMLHDNNAVPNGTPGNRPVLFTNIAEVLSNTSVILRDEFGYDIPQAYLTGIISKPDLGYYPKPTDFRKFLEIVNGGEVYTKEILTRLKLDSSKNVYSKFSGSTAFPKFSEDQHGVELTPDPYSSIKGNVLLEPKAAVLGGNNPDIIEPNILLPQIKAIAAMVLLAEQQN